MDLTSISALIEIIAFPVVVLVLWQLLFNSKNSRFSKFVIEGGYLLLVIPIIVLTFLSVPLMAIAFWARSTDINAQFGLFFLGTFIGISLIVEYYYIKRMIKQLEEKEQMSFWQIIKRELNPDVRKERVKQKIETKEEAKSFFDEITEMNKERRELDREQKEKLRRALLGEFDE